MKRKRFLIFAFTLAMVLTSYSMTFAETDAGSTAEAPAAFNDVSKHWAKDAIYKWSDKRVINGNDGSFRPNDSITRGEMAVILDNMMDYQAAANNPFTDLKAGQFYTESILKANAAGVIQGNGSKVRPTDKITREEAAVMLARAFAVDASTSGAATFNDASTIASWAKGYVSAMEVKSFVKGTNNNFLPKNKVTRAETVTMIDNIVKAYYTEAGTYTENVVGTAVVKVTGVILKGVTVSGNLIIAEGVGEGEVTLDSVTVTGKTVLRGGGENSVHIIGASSITSVRLERVDGVIRLVISDGNTVQQVTVAEGEEIIITGTIGTLDISAPNSVINATDANIGSTNISGSNATFDVSGNSTVGAVNVDGTASNTTIQTQSGAVVGTITAAASTTVSGNGTVSRVTLNEGANGSSITTPMTQITVGDGVTGTTGGGGIPIPSGTIGTNSVSGNGTTISRTLPTGGGGNSTPALSAINITGKAAVRSTLTATPTPTGATGSYQWQRSDIIDGPYLNIGTDSKTYTLTVEDEGKYIKVGITGSGIYTGAQISAGIGPVSAQPVMSGTVTIDGDTKYNDTLTANITGIIYTPNTSDNVPAYQWKRSGADIISATGTAYLLAENDIGEKITVTVTADGTNATGSGITSAETPAIAKADGPDAPEAPTLASKTHNTITLETIDGIEYCMNGGTWQSSTVFTSLASETAYHFTARIKETPTHLESAASSSTIIETNVFPVMMGSVTIDGVTKYNETLTANSTGLTYTPNTNSNVPAYQWKRNGTVISGATGNTHILVADDIGKAITVTVTADGTNATGAGITSAETSVIAKADGPDVPPMPTLGSNTHNTVTLAAITGAEYRMNGGAWQSISVFTNLAAETTYHFTARIKETAIHYASAESSAVSIETGVFPMMGGAVAINGNLKYNETLTANITGITYTPNTTANVPSYQWKRNGTAISGATGITYILAQADIGTTITVIVTADGTNATGAGITSAQTAIIVKADRPAPPAPTLASKTHNTVTLTLIGGAEYRMNGGAWQSSPVFTVLTAETSYSFTARIIETSTHLASAESSATTIETGVFPVMSGTVTINGVTKYNQTLTANITGITYTPSTSSNVPKYQWKRDGAVIGGATSKTYTLVETDIGTIITVTVTADGTNATGAGITSAETITIAKANGPSVPAAPTIASRTDTTVTLAAIAGGAYRMDGGAWQPDPVFTGLTARTVHSFTVRINESNTHLASAESMPTVITTSTNSRTINVLGVDLKMLYVPGGTFASGVEGTSAVNGYWMSETEVTYELWYAVRMWAKDRGYNFWLRGMEGSVTGGGDHVSNYPNVGQPPTSASQEPVTLITTYDMMAWLNALSVLTGKEQVYYRSLDGGYVFKDAQGAGITAGLTARAESNENGYRLPSKEQWEFAARWKGGDSSNGAVAAGGQYWTPWQYASGATANSSSAAGSVAWYDANSQKTQSVAQKTANGLGFYDMSGNVWEITYTASPGYSRFDGGSYTSSTSTLGVVGSWKFNNDDLGVTIEGTNIGFRLVIPAID